MMCDAHSLCSDSTGGRQGEVQTFVVTDCVGQLQRTGYHVCGKLMQ